VLTSHLRFPPPYRTLEVAKAGRKKKTKKARGIQDASPTKATSGFNKRNRYKNRQKQMKGLYQRLVAGGHL
jgi:hypothetical protein